MSIAGKSLASILGLLTLALSLGGAVLFWRAAGASTLATSTVVYLLCGIFLAMGIYLLAVAALYTVVLQADSFEVFEICRRRELARGEIEGRSHSSNGQRPPAWTFFPKPGLGKKLQLSTFLQIDEYFLSWIESLPDLDDQKKRAAEQERSHAIAALELRGFSEPGIRRLRQIAAGPNFAAYGLGLAGFFVSEPNHLTLTMIAIPRVAILLVAQFSPFFRFGGPRNSPLPDLSLPLMIPGLLLMLLVLRGINPVGWEGPALVSLIGSALLVGVALRCDPWLREHRKTAGLLLLLCCSYGYGAGMSVDTLLDGSAPQPNKVMITGKHVNHGKSTSYHLQIAPWGPYVSGQDLSVFRSQYVAAKRGDIVCMILRSGALGVAWSELGRCDNPAVH